MRKRKTYNTTRLMITATCQVNQKELMMTNHLRMKIMAKKYGIMSRQNVSSKTSILKKRNHYQMFKKKKKKQRYRNAVAWLFRFLLCCLKVIGVEISNTFLGQIIAVFPGTLYMLRQFVNFDRDDFNKYVVCPKCCKLYHYNECLTVIRGKQIAKTCSGACYSRGKRKTCGAAIVYSVKLNNGKQSFYPILMFLKICC